MKKDIAVIILAAGKGKRMKSSQPKVLHTVAARPMLGYVLDLAASVKPRYKICVLGYKSELVREYIRKEAPGFKIVIQKKLLGSGDALKQAGSILKNFKGTVLVLYGDNPLLEAQALKKLIRQHQQRANQATLLLADLDKPAGYGRIIRDNNNNICGIVEELQANDFEKDIKEINTGIACFDKEVLFRALSRVKLNPRKKEYYLTDVVGILHKQKALIGSLKIEDFRQANGINSHSQLSQAERIMQERLLLALQDKGVIIIDTSSTRVCWDTRIQAGTTVFPFTVIERNVKIGKNCRLGPFCHLRNGVVIQDNSVIGNFTEISRSKIGKGTIAKHFCFLGDSRIGNNVNIGAGTVTANYDGKRKSVTKIGDKVFIGSNTTLVAPLKLGKRSSTGAGSVLVKNRNVPCDTTVIGVPARPLKKKK